MAIVLTSTTSSQEEMNRVVSAEGDEWRKPPVIEEPKPDVEETKTNDESTAQDGAGGDKADGAKIEPERPPKKEHRKPSAKEQARFDRITKEKHEALARAEQAEKKLAELEAKKTEPDNPNLPKTGEPLLKDFKTPEEWANARDKWKNDQARIEEKKQYRQSMVDSYNKQAAEAEATLDDWSDAVKTASEIRVDPDNINDILDAIFELENGALVTHYLGTHPEDAQKLSEISKSKAAAIYMIRGISDKLAAQKAAPPAPKPKVKPPEPIAPVGGSSTRNSLSLDDPNVPISEFIKVRNKQEREARRR